MPESMHPESTRQENALTVSPEEAGMKLLRFLERRLPQAPSQGILHKWIRTGQVRINSGRAKAFALLEAGDIVRVPPFALGGADPKGTVEGKSYSHTKMMSAAHPDAPARATGQDCANKDNTLTPLDILADEGITIVAATKNILAINKPGGLAVQSGTGQIDSVAEKFKRAWSRHPYQPSPAHRLDRHTSGLLLAGLHHRAQQALHRAFAEGGVTKDYLAWVTGSWPENRPCLLIDSIYKTTLHTADGKSREVMQAADGGQCLPLPARNTREPFPCAGKAAFREKGYKGERGEGHAASVAMPVCFMHGDTPAQAGLAANTRYSGMKGSGATLMLVRLLTGRTHQIRVQFASRGFPLIGDGRYGGPAYSQMLLHAWRVALPAELAGMEPTPQQSRFMPPQGRFMTQQLGNELVFCVLPSWPPLFMPDEREMEQALKQLCRTRMDA